jgi:hypothetical protein
VATLVVSGSRSWYSFMRSEIDSQPFGFPGLVSISMTSTRDSGLTAVMMPMLAIGSCAHQAMMISGS